MPARFQSAFVPTVRASDRAGVGDEVTRLTPALPTSARNASPRLLQRLFAGLALAFSLGLAVSAATPNDPRFNAQWYLKKIGAPAAWEVTTGSRDVVVVVIDTGVNYKHPDLAANMWRNPGETGLDAKGRDKATNGIDDDGNGYIDDVYGIDVVDHDSDPMDRGFTRGAITTPYLHGTACAGVIGAVGNNANGTVGVNWAVSIMAIRAGPLDADRDWNNQKVTASFIEAFQYVLEMKRRGVNIVATSASSSLPSYSQALKDAIDACGREGILTVFPAGNSGMNNDQVGRYMGGYNSPSILSVAFSGQDDALDPASCYGHSTVHLAAPGVGIVTTSRDDFCCTSSAVPQVAGAVALLNSAMPDASAADIKAAILGSVDQPASMLGKVMSNGRLNVAKALARLTNVAAPAIVIAAHPAGPRTRPVDPIQITFSRPMDRASVEAATSFKPAIAGRFEWKNEDRTVTFIPDLPLVRTNYTATILRTAQDLRGDGLDGNFNGVRQDSTVDDYKWTFGFPVPNDDFADAFTIGDAVGSQKGTTRNASLEVEEPDHANNRLSSPSVWYRWTAPMTGWFTFDTLTATPFDSLLGVYTGNTLVSLTEIASNDNHGASSRSRTSFGAVAGTSYSIAVASKSYEADKIILDETRIGPFTLNWYPTPTPGFTGAQFSPASGLPGLKITLIGTNFSGATSVLFNGVSASFTNAPANNVDFRLIAVVPAGASSGPVTVVTPHGSVTSASVFEVLLPQLSVRAAGPGELEIAWPAGSAQLVLEVSATLLNDSWTPVLTVPVAEGSRNRVTEPLAGPARFYRLKK